MPRNRSYTDEEYIEAVKNSRSWRQVIHKLNLKVAGGTYTQMKKLAAQLGVSTEHMTGQGWNSGEDHISFGKKRTTESILVKNSSYTSTYHLKQRLWKEGLLKEACYICGIKDWNDKPLSLQIDHINGIRDDNTLNNLRILCPNCHSQTATYAGNNKGKTI